MPWRPAHGRPHPAPRPARVRPRRPPGGAGVGGAGGPAVLRQRRGARPAGQGPAARAARQGAALRHPRRLRLPHRRPPAGGVDPHHLVGQGAGRPLPRLAGHRLLPQARRRPSRRAAPAAAPARAERLLEHGGVGRAHRHRVLGRLDRRRGGALRQAVGAHPRRPARHPRHALRGAGLRHPPAALPAPGGLRLRRRGGDRPQAAARDPGRPLRPHPSPATGCRLRHRAGVRRAGAAPRPAGPDGAPRAERQPGGAAGAGAGTLPRRRRGGRRARRPAPRGGGARRLDRRAGRGRIRRGGGGLGPAPPAIHRDRGLGLVAGGARHLRHRLPAPPPAVG